MLFINCVILRNQAQKLFCHEKVFQPSRIKHNTTRIKRNTTRIKHNTKCIVKSVQFYHVSKVYACVYKIAITTKHA